MDPFVQALAGSGVVELLSREPSLEELFLSHYGARVGGDVGGDDAT